ncbi:COG1361 S-layer family protein [Candidatus Contubernalis alkaliaceticus]|uniref:COG1361 S-layer family protein n=1 Tax=Candidatus Contubernalis alkaliaceticus TaxID=338645 RepID=UPI001F4BECAD|nr:hypothetical protein [Candidatus Contubernalis alkalaceticus]UNC91997.1 hypothetical protein HUE98_07735 [Candidatus Contubernalis alkalaceticus]
MGRDDEAVSAAEINQTDVFGFGPALSIDTGHAYEGMKNSYAEGYLPSVSGGTAAVALPLLSESVTAPITAGVNLGDPAVSPFVYKNYEKQFSKKNYTFDSQTVECYLIQFSFALAAERVNGNYPITFTVSGKSDDGEAFSQEFILYVHISDGIDPMTSELEPSPSSSQPRLMVESYVLDRSYLEAGESSQVAVTIRNTSSLQDVKNIKLSFVEDSGEILPGGTGAEYQRQIAKGGSYTWSFSVAAVAVAQSKPHTATIMMEYEDSQGGAISASDRIILPVRQPVRLEYEEPSLPPRVTQGDTAPFTMTLMNLGKSTIYNALLKFEVPGLSTGGSLLVGTIPPGESQTGTTNFRVDSETPGRAAGTLFLSYEDEYGELYEKEIPLSTTIEKKLDTAALADADAETTASRFPGAAFAGGAILIALTYLFASRWLKQKKQREEDEMRL